MKLSLYLGTSVDTDIDAQSLFAGKVAEQVEAAIDSSFERVWVAEHHAASKYFPPPLQLLSWISGSYPGFGVGTNILLPALYHPLHLAEAVATTHLLSGERLMLGVGAGFRSAEFNAFGVDAATKYVELRQAVTHLRMLLSGQELTTRSSRNPGQRMSVQVRTKTLPPVLWAAMSDTGVRSAHGYANGILPNPLLGFERQFDLIEKFGALENRNQLASSRPVIADVVVGATPDSALAEAERVLTAEFSSFRHWREVSGLVAEIASGSPSFASTVGDVALVGTPQSIASRLHDFARRGATEAILRFEHLGSSNESVVRAIRAVGMAASSVRDIHND